MARLAGPSALEEVEIVLLKLMETLARWQAGQSPPRAFRITALHHRVGEPGIAVTGLDPFGVRARQVTPCGHAPWINLEPRLFLSKLAEHYRYAALHEILDGSLMAENQQRVQHFGYAAQKIERDSQALARQRDRLRQEEITEEIEVIMLSAETRR